MFKQSTSELLKVFQEIPVLRKFRTDGRMGELEVLGSARRGAPMEVEGEDGEVSEDRGKLG